MNTAQRNVINGYVVTQRKLEPLDVIHAARAAAKFGEPRVCETPYGQLRLACVSDQNWVAELLGKDGLYRVSPWAYINTTPPEDIAAHIWQEVKFDGLTVAATTLATSAL